MLEVLKCGREYALILVAYDDNSCYCENRMQFDCVRKGYIWTDDPRSEKGAAEGFARTDCRVNLTVDAQTPSQTDVVKILEDAEKDLERQSPLCGHLR